MSSPSQQLSNDALQRHQKTAIDLVYEVTGAKAGRFSFLPPQALVGYDNTTFTQAEIDRVLESSGDFSASVFGTTAMGVDALGFVLNCDRQIAAAYAIRVVGVIGTTAVSLAGAPATLADTLPTNPRVQVSPLGNLGVQMVVTGLDAATSGRLLIKILVDLK